MFRDSSQHVEGMFDPNLQDEPSAIQNGNITVDSEMPFESRETQLAEASYPESSSHSLVAQPVFSLSTPVFQLVQSSHLDKGTPTVLSGSLDMQAEIATPDLSTRQPTTWSGPSYAESALHRGYAVCGINHEPDPRNDVPIQEGFLDGIPRGCSTCENMRSSCRIALDSTLFLSRKMISYDDIVKQNEQMRSHLSESNTYVEDTLQRISNLEVELNKTKLEASQAKQREQDVQKQLGVMETKAKESMQHAEAANTWREKYTRSVEVADLLHQKRIKMSEQIEKLIDVADRNKKSNEEAQRQMEALKREKFASKERMAAFRKYVPMLYKTMQELSFAAPNQLIHTRKRLEMLNKPETKMILLGEKAASADSQSDDDAADQLESLVAQVNMNDCLDDDTGSSIPTVSSRGGSKRGRGTGRGGTRGRGGTSHAVSNPEELDRQMMMGLQRKLHSKQDENDSHNGPSTSAISTIHGKRGLSVKEQQKEDLKKLTVKDRVAKMREMEQKSLNSPNVEKSSVHASEPTQPSTTTAIDLTDDAVAWASDSLSNGVNIEPENGPLPSTHVAVTHDTSNTDLDSLVKRKVEKPAPMKDWAVDRDLEMSPTPPSSPVRMQDTLDVDSTSPLRVFHEELPPEATTSGAMETQGASRTTTSSPLDDLGFEDIETDFAPLEGSNDAMSSLQVMGEANVTGPALSGNIAESEVAPTETNGAIETEHSTAADVPVTSSTAVVGDLETPVSHASPSKGARELEAADKSGVHAVVVESSVIPETPTTSSAGPHSSSDISCGNGKIGHSVPPTQSSFNLPLGPIVSRESPGAEKTDQGKQINSGTTASDGPTVSFTPRQSELKKPNASIAKVSGQVVPQTPSTPAATFAVPRSAARLTRSNSGVKAASTRTPNSPEEDSLFSSILGGARFTGDSISPGSSKNSATRKEVKSPADSLVVRSSPRLGARSRTSSTSSSKSVARPARSRTRRDSSCSNSSSVSRSSRASSRSAAKKVAQSSATVTGGNVAKATVKARGRPPTRSRTVAPERIRPASRATARHSTPELPSSSRMGAPHSAKGTPVAPRTPVTRGSRAKTVAPQPVRTTPKRRSPSRDAGSSNGKKSASSSLSQQSQQSTRRVSKSSFNHQPAATAQNRSALDLEKSGIPSRSNTRTAVTAARKRDPTDVLPQPAPAASCFQPASSIATPIGEVSDSDDDGLGLTIDDEATEVSVTTEREKEESTPCESGPTTAARTRRAASRPRCAATERSPAAACDGPSTSTAATSQPTGRSTPSTATRSKTRPPPPSIDQLNKVTRNMGKGSLGVKRRSSVASTPAPKRAKPAQNKTVPVVAPVVSSQPTRAVKRQSTAGEAGGTPAQKNSRRTGIRHDHSQLEQNSQSEAEDGPLLNALLMCERNVSAEKVLANLSEEEADAIRAMDAHGFARALTTVAVKLRKLDQRSELKKKFQSKNCGLVQNKEEENLLLIADELTPNGMNIWFPFVSHLVSTMSEMVTIDLNQCGCFIRLISHALYFEKTNLSPEQVTSDEKRGEVVRALFALLLWNHRSVVSCAVLFWLTGRSWELLGFLSEDRFSEYRILLETSIEASFSGQVKWAWSERFPQMSPLDLGNGEGTVRALLDDQQMTVKSELGISNTVRREGDTVVFSDILLRSMKLICTLMTRNTADLNSMDDLQNAVSDCTEFYLVSNSAQTHELGGLFAELAPSKIGHGIALPLAVGIVYQLRFHAELTRFVFRSGNANCRRRWTTGLAVCVDKLHDVRRHLEGEKQITDNDSLVLLEIRSFLETCQSLTAYPLLS